MAQANIDKIELEGGAVIYLAQTLEVEDFDSIQLDSYDIFRLEAISGVGRKREFYTVRWMLRQILPLAMLRYSEKGAPYLQGDNREISISHCDSLVAIMVDNTACGVDLERADRNFSRVASRYLTSKDAKVETQQQLAAVWCAKEAVFKLLKGEIEGMIEQVEIVKVADSYVECRCELKYYKVAILERQKAVICYVRVV